MAVKDCTFFVDVNGRQVEMDFDGFRAYLMEEAGLARLAPDLFKKRGKKAGFEAARAEAAPVRAEATPAKAEAAPVKAEAPSTKKTKETGKTEKQKGFFKVTNTALREIFNVTKEQATGIAQLAKAMGIDLDQIRLARGEIKPIAGAGLEQRGVTSKKDAEYMAAVKAGDTAKAQKMVDEAAKAAGYENKAYHGSPVDDITQFDEQSTALGYYFAPDPATANYYTGTRGDGRTYEVYLRMNKTLDLTDESVFEDFIRSAVIYTEERPRDDVQKFAARLYKEGYGKNPAVTSFFNSLNDINLVKTGELSIEELLEEQYIDSSDINPLVKAIDKPNVTSAYDKSAPPSSEELDDVRQAYGTQQFYMEYQSDLFQDAVNLGYDSVIFDDPSTTGESLSYVVFDSNQIKSADPITYDNKGNVIPLSKRFRPETPDIRYQTGYHAARGLFEPEPGFPNGRFRLDKIGTGLGGQAYGWGIYLAPERPGASSYYDALKAESPTAVLYELDVPDDIVGKLLDFGKPIPNKLRVAVNRELKAQGVDLEIDASISLGEAIEQIQDAAFPDSEDYAKLTSELLDRAGIPGLQVSAYGEKRPYVIWNQDALDRVALLKANEKTLGEIGKAPSPLGSIVSIETENGADYWYAPPEETPQGLITFMDREEKRMTNGVLAVIRGFSAANVSTPIHEMFHFYRRFLLNEENGFTAAEIKAFEDWAGAKDGVWSVEADEKAARGFERYLRSGEAPLPSLNKLFEKLAKWFQDIYKTVIGSEIDVEITPEIRRVFDRIFELQAKKVKATGGERTLEQRVEAETKATSHNILYQTKAESLGGDSTAKARAEAIRQNRERMQARREQARGDTSKQPAGGGNAQQQKGGTSASRQGRTRSKPQTLSDMLRIAEEQVQAAAEREPQTDTERRQVQAQRAVMALLRDYVRLKAQGNLPDSYTKADGTQVNREAELFDALTVMLNSATNPDDDARKATRKALSARFDEILPGRVKSKAGQPKTLQDMLREAQRNIRGTAGKKVLSPQEQAQERADQEIKYLIREYAQKMYAGRLADDLELPDGTTVSREQELLDALDALRNALKMPSEGLRLKARADAMRRVDFALLAPPLETRKQPLNIRNMLTGHAWGKYSIRSPLSYLNYLGSYERIAGTTGRDVSDIFNQVRTRFARGQYRDFNSALADLRIQLRPLKQQLIDEGYRGLPEVINAHVQRIEESSRNLGDLTVANVKKAWQNGDLNLAANLLSSILKAFVFNAKLRLNPKSIGLNYLQPLFTLYPYFTSEELVQLYNDSLNPDTRARVRDIAIAESGGRFTLEMRQGQTSRIPNPFTAASEQVRIMGHLAGEMLADRLKLSEGIERDMYIRSWAEKAEFDNSPWNAGPLFTGPIASVVLQFKPYMVKNLERFVTDIKSNPIIGERISEKKQPITARQAKVLLVQAGIGGLSSLLTLAPPLRILAGPIMLGLLAKFIGELADDEEVGERMAEAIYFGVPSAFALDLSSSVGFIEEPFGRSPADKFASALGPAVSMAYQGYTQADDIYELATRPQKVGESEAIKKELGERTWKLGKALTPYTRMVEAGYSLATGTRPEMFLDEKTPLTTGETIGRLFGLSPVRQASYYEMKEAPDFAKRLVGMQPDIAGIPRERGETDKTYRVKVQRVTEWRNSYGKQLENHPRFKTLDQATKDKALDIINGNISTEAAKQKPNVRNLRPEYIIRRAKESVRQAPKRAKRQMYVPPPRD